METTKKSLNNNISNNSSNSSNMVLSRPNSSNGISILNLTTTNDSTRNSNYHARGHSNHKFNQKSGRNNNSNYEDIMLQRPTPIILAKPVVKENLNGNNNNNNTDTKDENQKPLLKNNISSLQSNANQAKQINVKLLESNGTNNKTQLVKNGLTLSQQQLQQQQPILANLSTNLANSSQVKLKQVQQINQPPPQQQQVKEVPQVQETPKPTNEKPSLPATSLIESLTQRLSNNTQTMLNSVKLLDETLQWNDSLNDYLSDQSDFLVIGILGKKGVGKSTVMSLLAGSKFDDSSPIFKTSKDSLDFAQHKTSGINAFVTSERTILLDVQPLISGSVLDKTISTDKKHLNNDFKYYENYVEMQSIELACFVLSVCNVVIVLEDWFFDPNLFRLIQTAEMLMPHNSLAQHEEYQLENHPHLVYVLNKIEYLNKLDLIKMKSIVDQLLHDSKLIYKGSLNNLDTSNGLNLISKQRRGTDKSSSVNLAFIPKVSEPRQTISEFDGLASLTKSVKCLLRELLSVRRGQSMVNHLNNTNSNVNNLQFSEKRWFAYANKVWETIRKSQLIGEYNRLMT